jgi:dolichol-phosphate mannosyltransferase
MDQLGSTAQPALSGTVPALSVVIPFFNEGPNVAALLAELREALERLGVSHEVLAVDDGSADDTAAALAAAARDWPAARVISFPQNRGQAAALWVGFREARGAWIASLDGDGQNPPADLKLLWEQRESADLITGRRADRHDSWLRRTMSSVANGVRGRLLRDGVDDSGCALRLFRREVRESFWPIRTLYSFIPAFAAAGGWRIRQVDVGHRARKAGTSKYGLLVMAWRPLCDMLALFWLLKRQLPRA